jgi:unsaturated rhamnogalacturonyl hydrolase
VAVWKGKWELNFYHVLRGNKIPMGIIMNTLKISEKLFERYESTQRVYHYYGLVALYALAQTATESNDNSVLKKCIEMLSLYPDNFDHPNYNFESYRIGGNGKLWLAYKGYFENEHENIRIYAEKTMAGAKESDGILCAPWCPPEKETVFVDVITAVTPFMLYAGLILNEEKYIDFAAEQCFKIYDVLLDKTCGLLHQARGFMENKELVSSDHWSRGNGWGYLGLADLVAYLPADSKHRAKAEKYFKDMSEAFLKYQTDKGVWRQEITAPYSWIEASGTGLITYGIGVGLRCGLLEKGKYQVPFENAINGILKLFINDDFSTKMTCCSCLCPGQGEGKGSINAYLTEVYPEKDEPHSYGPLMLAFVEAYRNGIINIDFM